LSGRILVGKSIFLLYNLHTLLLFRFIRICYLFEREGQQFLHGQWLAHGSKTLLQEAAHSNGLFLMNTCDDVPLDSIVQKCNLHWLSADSTEPPEDALNRFYCSGLIWDEDLGAFLETTQTSSSIGSSQTCAICDSQAVKEKSEGPILNLGSISYLGTQYHELDFIYVINKEDEDSPYIIAQVLSFSQDDASKTIHVQIRLLKHYDCLVKQGLTFDLPNLKDEHRLYFTLKTETISAEYITGKCYVQHPSAISNLEAWFQHVDHFYVQDYSVNPPFIGADDCHRLQMLDPSTHSFCKPCYKEHIKILEENKLLYKRNRPLQAL